MRSAALVSEPLPLPYAEAEDEEEDDEGANDSAGAIASESPRRFGARVGDLSAEAEEEDDDVGEPSGPVEDKE